MFALKLEPFLNKLGLSEILVSQPITGHLLRCNSQLSNLADMSFAVHYNWSFSVKTFNFAYRKYALFIKMAQINIAKLVVSFSTICSL